MVTCEFENVPAAGARAAGRAAPVVPGAKAFAVAQDRLAEKDFIAGLGIPVAPLRRVDDAADLRAAHLARAAAGDAEDAPLRL